VSHTITRVRTRLSDLAEQAGVSTATVSRVLNGKPGVASSTRQSVLAALDVLGYERPSSLRGRSAGLVGLVVPELTNPVFPAFAQAVESVLAQRGYTPLLCTQAPGGTTEDEYVSTLVDHSVAGIIFISGLHADTRAKHGRYELLRSQGVPIVLVNGHAPGIDAPFVSPDDAEAVDVSVQHLVTLGHTRIGLAIGPERYVPARRKVHAFTAALVRHGLAADEAAAQRHVLSTLYTLEGGQVAAGELFDGGHTAVVCGSDIMALGAVRAARARGLSVPGDVSVVGMDGLYLCALTSPGLTTVRLPVPAMAQTIVERVIGRMADPSLAPGEFLFAPELELRDSVAAPSATKGRP
jgi:LacI family repressor for deo operon, udp, cdd, tsx, nupC, and nupG